MHSLCRSAVADCPRAFLLDDACDARQTSADTHFLALEILVCHHFCMPTFPWFPFNDGVTVWLEMHNNAAYAHGYGSCSLGSSTFHTVSN
jgi:hypothetical protein